MNDYAIELLSSCLDGIVTDYNGPIADQTIEDFAANHANVDILDDGGNAWPTLMFRNMPTAPSLVICGVPMTAIIVGSHPINPPYRPK